MPYWTNEQYLEWLSDVLRIVETYVTSNQRLPKGFSRFTYWDFPIFTWPAFARLDPAGADRMRAFANPVPQKGQKHHGRIVATAPPPEVPPRDLRPAAKEMLAAGHQMAIASGDKKAIFEYAKDDYEAFADPFVIRRLIEWRLDGSPAAEKQFYRLVRAYWSRQGKRAGPSTLQLVGRDQDIYRAYLCRESSQSRESFIDDQVGKHSISDDSVAGVLKAYDKHRKQWLKGDVLWPFPPPSADY
jgi:hypothetical protein